MNTRSVWRPDKDEIVVERGAVATAHPIAAQVGVGVLPLEQLLEPAVHYAREGVRGRPRERRPCNPSNQPCDRKTG